MKDYRKNKRLSILVIFTFSLGLFSGLLTVFDMTKSDLILNDNINDDTNDNPNIKIPEMAQMTELTGTSTSVGIYGYTNGTLNNDFEYNDGWTDLGGYYGSPEYTITAPAPIGSQTWQIDTQRVEVADLSDIKNYIPDADFSAGAAAWDTSDQIPTATGGNGEVTIETGSPDYAKLQFTRDAVTNNVLNFDGLTANSPSGSATRIQTPGGIQAGDIATSTMTVETASDRMRYDTQFDSFADDHPANTGCDWVGGSCSRSASVSITDSWSSQFSTETNFIWLDYVNDPTADIDFDIFYENSWSRTTDTIAYDNWQSGSYDPVMSSGVQITLELKRPDLSYIQLGTTHSSLGAFSRATTVFTGQNQNFANIDISSAFTIGGQYRLRLKVLFQMSTVFSGTAYEARSCSDNSQTCNAQVYAEMDNRLRVYVGDIDLAYQDVGPLDDGDADYEGDLVIQTLNNMNFEGRQVEEWQDGVLSFDYFVRDDLRGYMSGLEYGLQDSYVAAWLTIDGGSPIEYTSANNIKTDRGSLRMFSRDIDGSLLDGATTIKLAVGLKIKDFTLDWECYSSGAYPDSAIYIYDIQLHLKGMPDVDDVALRIRRGTNVGAGSTVNFIPTTKGAGYADVTDWIVNLAGGSFGAYFWTSSEKLNFTFTHTVRLSYKDWSKTTTYHSKSGANTDFYLNFTQVTPWVTTASYSDTYQENFYYDIVFPKYNYGGEPYWDIISASIDGHAKDITGEENVSNVDENWNIYVQENGSHTYGIAPWTVKQFANVYNDLFDEWIQGSSQSLNWNILFRSPNYLSNLLIANSSAVFPSETDLYIAGIDSIYIRGIMSETANEGNASVRALTPGEVPIGTEPFADVSGLNQFESSGGGIVIDNTYSSADDYIAYAGYTATDIANLSSGDTCIGIYKAGYQMKNFEVIRDTILTGPIMNIQVFDTTTDSGLIEIKVNFEDSESGFDIIDATATITIGEFTAKGTASKKEATYYNTHGWIKNNPMINLGNGSYVIYIDPSRASDGSLIGNMTWGFHNFTINIAKDGYISKQLEGNYSIIIDSYLQLWTPFHNPDVSAPWVHFMDTQPAGDAITFSTRFMANDSAVPSPLYNDTGLYNGMISINYTLVNSTDGLINWTALAPLIGAGFNPINGSFTGSESASVFEAVIKWPTFDVMNSTNFPNYVPDIILEYNITALIRINNTILPDETEPTLIVATFQPDLVEGGWCENESTPGFNNLAAGYLKVEETLRIRLVEYDSVNKTIFRFLNNETDNNDAFAMGIYDNMTEGEDGDQQYYEVTNYYNNNTNPWFQLRGIFNCSKILRDLNADEAPPVGPLNETNEFFGQEIWWAGNTSIKCLSDYISFDFTPDESYLWTTEVNHTLSGGGSGTKLNVSGVTYVSPKLYFSDYTAGTYEATISASKPGFESSYVPIKFIILPQNTTAYNETGDEIDTSANPIKITIPRRNATSFVFYWNDTTNPGAHETINSFESIEIYNDEGMDIYKDNNTGGQPTWSVDTLGNGKYEVTIVYTDLSPSPTPRLLYFRVNRENYSSAEFKVELTIRQRNASIQIIWKKNNGNGVFDHQYYNTLDHAHIILSYEILDLDNMSVPVYLTSGQVSASFDVGYFDWKQVSVNDASTSFRWRYNITIGTNRPVGLYWVNLSITGLEDYYDMAHGSATIFIENVTTNITVTFTDIVKEFLHYSQSITTLSNLPRIDFTYYDEDHNDYIDLQGAALEGNWTNGLNNGGSSLNPGGGAYEDILMQDGGNGDGLVYFDIQMNTSSVNEYFVEIRIVKTNYETVIKVVNFTIINQTTTFEEFLGFDIVNIDVEIYQKGSWYAGYSPALSKVKANENRVFYWGTTVRYRFIYKSASNDIVKLDNDTANGLPVFASLIGVPVNLTYIFSNTGVGGWEFTLDFSDIDTVGTVNILFNISIEALNFEKIEFGINVTLNDRTTSYTIEDRRGENVYWTENAYFEFKMLDLEFSGLYGLSGAYYVDFAKINGTNIEPDFGLYVNGSLSTEWSFQEDLNGLYKIFVNTTGLEASQTPYTIEFNITKAHWEDTSIAFNITIKPVALSIVITIVPSPDFVPSETPEIRIEVSVFATLWGEEQEIGVDYSLAVTVSFKITKENDTILEGILEWDNGAQKFITNITTVIDGNPLSGIYDFEITVTTDNINFADSSESINLLALGTRVGEIPFWFWPLLMSVIGAAIAMAGYGIKKAIYLRIPFVLRKIDETTKKIEKGKFPAVGVMTGRDEFIINSVINYLEICGIEWEREDKFEIKKVGEGAAKEKLAAFKLGELEAELAKIPEISAEEKALFLEELTRLDREAQEEFLNSLRGNISK